MVFVHPAAWWLLVLLVPVAVLHVRQRMGLSPGRVVWVTLLRTVVLTLLIAALARPILERPDNTYTTVAVVDVSGSIADADLAGVDRQLQSVAGRRSSGADQRLILFASEAGVVAWPNRDSTELAELRGTMHPGRSVPTQALDLASALIRNDGRGRVLLFTDGLATHGDVRAAGTRLAERGILVDATTIGLPRQAEVLIRNVDMPPYGRLGATVTLDVTVESAEPGPARLVLRRDTDGQETVVEADLHGGEQHLSVPCPLVAPGLVRYAVRIESAADTDMDNNSRTAALEVGPPLDVRVVEDAPGTPARRALAALLGSSAQVSSVAPADLLTSGCLEAADVLVLADTPADSLPPDALEQLRDAVTAGLGLIVTGGRRALGPGGYADTPVAEVLPVRCLQELERRDPSATLVVVIDTSGSMGGPRVNLAKEIARLAIARLKPHDKVGIVEFYGSKRWAAPIQPASNAIDLQRALNRLSSGGGTVILPAIEEALYGLQNVHTRTKHVLVLTDGGVEPGAFEPLIRQMVDKGITLSTVLVGPELHSGFLANLAQWGRGRFYTAPDRFNLPEIIVKQPESAVLAPFIETPTPVLRRRNDPLLQGIDADPPPLDGYVQTEARPTADVLLASAAGHPVLARWRYGLGSVAVLTTQIGGDWSRSWVDWPPYAGLMSNVVRALARPGKDTALQIHTVVDPAGATIVIDNLRPAGADACAAVELSLTGNAGLARPRVLDPVQPNYWQTHFADLPTGVYRLQAQTTDGGRQGSAALTIPAIPEISALEPDHEFFRNFAELRIRAEQRAAELSARRPTRPREVWPLLVGAALPLFLLNVLVRRWPRRTAAWASALTGMFLLLGSIEPTRAQDSPVPSFAALPLDPEPSALLSRALQAPNEDARQADFAEACRLARQRDGTLDALLAHLRQVADDGADCARLVAQAACANGDLALARSTLTQAAARFQTDARLHADLARVEELTGNDEAALAAVNAALAAETDPSRRVALRVREALLHYDADSPGQGAAALQRVVAEQPESQALVRYCAHLAALNADWGAALDLLAVSRESAKAFHDHLFRGLWYLRLDRNRAAENEFEQACLVAPLARDHRFAIERLAAAARRGGRLPVLVDAWLVADDLPAERLNALIGLLREMGRSAEALDLLRRPAQTPEQQVVLESPDFQREIVALAVESGQTAQAEVAYRTLIERHPQQTEWRSGLARLLLLDGRDDEARQLFNQAIEPCTDAAALFALSDAARRLALDDAALTAARKAGATGPTGAVRALLFEADLVRQRGDADRAGEILHQLADLGRQNDRILLAAAEALERYGDRGEALRLYEQLDSHSSGEDVRLKLAWLLEEGGRLEEAAAIWKRMWQTTEVAARRRQAQERLLDLTARTGKLADLAIELEDALQRGSGREVDLELLVEVYTRANDPVSAAEILYEFAQRSGDEVGAAQRLAQVYLKCEQFGRCNAVLRRLVQLDPANADDYLSQIAMVALERRQPAEARAALAELEARAGDRTVAEELGAGVLDLLGVHEEAAGRYDRLMARHPDRIEALLLWANALSAAGKADRAVVRFQVLTEEAAEDDLFTVAVDGLLNMQAKPPALRAALRRVRARIAANPEKVFLYQLAVDLLEALGRKREMADLLEQSVVVAGERRGPLLRELLDGSKADGQSARVIEFGRSLLALGEEMPPQVFLDLGEALVKDGQLAVAERVFERAALGADYSAVQQRVAGYYEDAGLFAAADRVIRQLLISEPDNVALLIRSGDLGGYLGRFDRAVHQFRDAADLLIRRLPSTIRLDERSASQPAGEPDRPRGRAANLSEIEQYLDSAVGGLLEAARDAAGRSDLLRDLEQRLRTEMAALQASGNVAAKIAGNPRLERLAHLLRQVAFALHEPDLADAADRELLALFPTDAALRRALVEVRQTWGLDQRAAAFADAASELGSKSAALQLHVLLSDPPRLDNALAAGQLEAELAGRLTPILIMEGREAQAARALRAVQTSEATTWGTVAPVMLAAARALDDREAGHLWAEAWLSAALRNRVAGTAARQIEECLAVVWGNLTPDERMAVPARLTLCAEALPEDGRVAVDLLRLRLARSLGTQLPDAAAILERAAGTDSLSAAALARVLDQASAEERPALLRRMVAARKPAAARAFLLEVAGALIVPADEQLVDAFATLLQSTPRPRLDPQRAYSLVCAGGWHRNRRQPEVARRLGEILLGESPNEPAVLVAVAVARNNAGLYDQAVLLIDEALEALLAVNRPDFPHRTMLGDAVDVLKPADVLRLLAQIDERIDVEGPTPMSLLARAELAAAADPGLRAEAAAAYRAAYEAAPDNMVISRRMISFFKEEGRHVELTRLLATHLTKSTVMESLEWRTLAEVYGGLFDLHAADQAARRDESPLGPVQVMAIARRMGDEAQVAATFRRFVTRHRNEQRFFEPFWPDDPLPGGLLEHLAVGQRKPLERLRMFEALGLLPFAEHEFRALLTAAGPLRRDVPGLVRGLAAAVEQHGSREKLLSDLAAYSDRQALTAQDQLLLLALGQHTATPLPERLSGACEAMLRRVDAQDTETLSRLARAARNSGRLDQARRILRWLVALDTVEGGATVRLDERVARLNDYLALLPDDKQAAERLRMLSAWEPTPAVEPADEFEAARLRCWLESGDREAAAQQLAAAEKFLAAQADQARYRALATHVARGQACAGRLVDFTATVQRVIGTQDRRLAFRRDIDCRDVLPPPEQLPDPAACVAAVQRALEESRSARTLDEVAFTQSLLLLGHWCVEARLLDVARSLRTEAEQAAGQLGAHWLWIADLARLLGDEESALAIEIHLMESDLLPVIRVPELLAAVARHDGDPSADLLAGRVAAYSDHPVVLQRAVAAAERAGDAPTVAALRARLRPADAGNP